MLIGIDLGGTNIKFGLVSRTGDLHKLNSTPTNGAGGPQAVINRIAGCIEQLMDQVLTAAIKKTSGLQEVSVWRF